jgi:hypothetical protein
MIRQPNLTAERAMMAELSEFCVYTIRHRDRLKPDAEGIFKATEGRRWVTARRLLDKAKAANRALPIVFGDAAYGGPLVCWAILRDIKVSDSGTEYTYYQLTPLPPEYTPEKDMVLRKAGRPIARKYIRPYAICRTPDFVR